MNTEIKPQITVNLSPVLEAYCRWIFKTPENEKSIMISRRHDVGKHIFSHVMKSEFPVKKRPIKEGYRLVTFILPVPDNSGYQLNNHYLYIDDLVDMQINDFIKADFNAWCREKFERGYNFGWLQESTIKAILRGLNLRNNIENKEAVKKNDYRCRKKKEEERFKMLLEAD
jgi:hypothetical protein